MKFKNLKILITGGTGFVGSALSRSLLEKNHQVSAIGTSPSHPLADQENFHYVSADTTQKGKWQDLVPESDVIINLAGRNIFHYWTKAYKNQIYETRVRTTRNLVDALPGQNEVTLCSASAAGYYGNRSDQILTENTEPGSDFLATVCVDWEKEAFQAEIKGSRVITMRFGVVLGPGGGALQKMVPAYKMFVGGPLGDGEQWFPWIHIQDLMAAVSFIIHKPEIHGPVNFTAPGTIQNHMFAKALARALKRPSFFKTPAFLIKTVMGELGESFLSSQKAIPEKLGKHGFHFTYPNISAALSTI
ncbi:MAG: TIGR01777 family protein [Desulfobacteraceae bacterium]|nr:MAG: TIGR01777 family protein [Desulfobacteraceae bacterium]